MAVGDWPPGRSRVASGQTQRPGESEQYSYPALVGRNAVGLREVVVATLAAEVSSGLPCGIFPELQKGARPRGRRKRGMDPSGRRRLV